MVSALPPSHLLHQFDEEPHPIVRLAVRLAA
jgi:hypothetical protein